MDAPPASRAPLSTYAGPPRGELGAGLRYLSMGAKTRLAYRGDLAIRAGGNLLVATIGVVFLWAVFRHVPDIVGWSFAEVLFIWGMAEATAGGCSVLFAGLWQFNQRYLVQGELDRTLLRPVDPYLQVLLDNASLEHLPQALLGLAMMAAALADLPPLDALRWVLLPVFLAGGLAVLGGILTAVSAIGFFVLHRGTTVGLVFQATSFNRYPLDVFDKWLQRGLTFALPLAFATFFPAAWLLHHQGWGLYAALQPAVGLALFAAGRALWVAALGRYRSAGS